MTTSSGGSRKKSAKLSKTCFVICPIGSSDSDDRKRSDQLFNHIIQPVCADLGYEVLRADNLPDPGVITNQIMELLVNAELVVADLTGRNPNVFYELGVRHCTGKPFVQLMFEKAEVPFDIANVRTLAYSLDLDKFEIAKNQLKSMIEWIDNNPSKVVNPVLLAKNLGTLLGGDSSDQSQAQMMTLLLQISKDVSEVQQNSHSTYYDLDDVESSVSDLDSSLDEVKQALLRIERMVDKIERSTFDSKGY